MERRKSSFTVGENVNWYSHYGEQCWSSLKKWKLVRLYDLAIPLLGIYPVVVVQSLSHIWFFAILWSAARWASLSFTISLSLLKLTSIESGMPSSHPQSPPSPLALNLSRHQVFSNESALRIRRAKYWSFSISPSNEYSRLISFRVDWFDLLAVQVALQSSPAPQFESINSLMLSLLYGSSLIPIQDYWKTQSDISAF